MEILLSYGMIKINYLFELLIINFDCFAKIKPIKASSILNSWKTTIQTRVSNFPHMSGWVQTAGTSASELTYVNTSEHSPL